MEDSIIPPELRREFEILQAMPADSLPKQKHWRDNLTGVNGRDPMSPYTLPESIREYQTVTDIMNYKGFLCYYPQSYTPISNYFRDNNITPYFNPSEAEDWSKGLLTVAGMVELISMGQTFEICRDNDFDEIIAIASTYVRHAEQIGDPNLDAYVKQVRYFLELAESSQRKIFRRHHKEDKISMDFFSFLKRIFGSQLQQR